MSQAALPSYSTTLWRGFRSRCPRCGTGKLFRRFLKVADNCPACQEAYHHHRADDLPAYLLILVLGHILVPLIVTVELLYEPPYWLYVSLWLPATVVLAVGLLQPIKGMVVALQWRMGMHGFFRG